MTEETYCEIGQAFRTQAECSGDLRDVTFIKDEPFTVTHAGRMMQFSAQEVTITCCEHHYASRAVWQPEGMKEVVQ